MITHDPNTQVFDCVIVSPDKTLFQGKAVKLQVPGIVQELALLPDHTPMYAELVAGTITVTPLQGQEITVPIESGVLRFRANKASILTGFGGNMSQSKK